MQMNRRGFLKTCLALAAAPAVVRADSLMKLWVPPQELIVPAQELASAEFMAIQLEAEGFGGRYIASALVKAGNEWVRKSVSGAIDGLPTISINAKGEIELVGAKDCVEMTSLMGDRFDPKDYGIHGEMVLTGDANYIAQEGDAYARLNGIVGQYSDTPEPSRLVRNLISGYQEQARTNLLAGSAAFGAAWGGE